MRTTAHRDDRGWILRGQKQWITSGDRAGVLVVWARTGDGLSCFLVPEGAPGLRIGRAEDKMGIRASSTVALTLDECQVEAGALLGAEGQGLAIALAALDGGRIGISAQAIGIARAALATATNFARQAAPDTDDAQSTAFALADCRADLEAADGLCLRAAWLKEAGRPFGHEASMAKLYASEAAVRICNRALQVHGEQGYLRAAAVERHLRDARVTTIYEGTSEIQRLVIARGALR